MQFILFLFMSMFSVSQPVFQIDFGNEKDGQDWRIINDGVMGGLSKGYLDFQEDVVVFKGEVSLANNGGFTSFRSPYQSFDLSAYEKVVIRLKSTGYPISFTLNTDQRWYQPYFKQAIVVNDTDWQTIELPLKDFKAYRLGQNLGYGLDKTTAAGVIRLGFITDSKKESTFEAMIDYVRFE